MARTLLCWLLSISGCLLASASGNSIHVITPWTLLTAVENILSPITYVLDALIIVPVGAVLRIPSGTMINISENGGVQVAGMLIVDGAQGNTTTFFGSGGNTVAITLQPGGDAVVAFTNFLNLNVSIAMGVGGSLSISDSTFNACATILHGGSAASPVAVLNRVQVMNSRLALDNVQANISDSIFFNNSRAIYNNLILPLPVTIARSIFAAHTVALEVGQGVITDSIFYANNLALVANDALAVSGSVIINSTLGLQLSRPDLFVNNNLCGNLKSLLYNRAVPATLPANYWGILDPVTVYLEAITDTFSKLSIPKVLRSAAVSSALGGVGSVASTLPGGSALFDALGTCLGPPCNATSTCSGKGFCSSWGGCNCIANWGGSDCSQCMGTLWPDGQCLPSCTQSTTCAACSALYHCGWCSDTNTCQEFFPALNRSYVAPAACASRSQFCPGNPVVTSVGFLGGSPRTLRVVLTSPLTPSYLGITYGGTLFPAKFNCLKIFSSLDGLGMVTANAPRCLFISDRIVHVVLGAGFTIRPSLTNTTSLLLPSLTTFLTSAVAGLTQSLLQYVASEVPTPIAKVFAPDNVPVCAGLVLDGTSSTDLTTSLNTIWECQGCITPIANLLATASSNLTIAISSSLLNQSLIAGQSTLSYRLTVINQFGLTSTFPSTPGTYAAVGIAQRIIYAEIIGSPIIHVQPDTGGILRAAVRVPTCLTEASPFTYTWSFPGTSFQVPPQAIRDSYLDLSPATLADWVGATIPVRLDITLTSPTASMPGSSARGMIVVDVPPLAMELKQNKLRQGGPASLSVFLEANLKDPAQSSTIPVFNWGCAKMTNTDGVYVSCEPAVLSALAASTNNNTVVFTLTSGPTVATKYLFTVWCIKGSRSVRANTFVVLGGSARIAAKIRPDQSLGQSLGSRVLDAQTFPYAAKPLYSINSDINMVLHAQPSSSQLTYNWTISRYGVNLALDSALGSLFVRGTDAPDLNVRAGFYNPGENYQVRLEVCGDLTQGCSTDEIDLLVRVPSQADSLQLSVSPPTGYTPSTLFNLIASGGRTDPATTTYRFGFTALGLDYALTPTFISSNLARVYLPAPPNDDVPLTVWADVMDNQGTVVRVTAQVTVMCWGYQNKTLATQVSALNFWAVTKIAQGNYEELNTYIVALSLSMQLSSCVDWQTVLTSANPANWAPLLTMAQQILATRYATLMRAVQFLDFYGIDQALDDLMATFGPLVRSLLVLAPAQRDAIFDGLLNITNSLHRRFAGMPIPNIVGGKIVQILSIIAQTRARNESTFVNLTDVAGNLAASVAENVVMRIPQTFNTDGLSMVMVGGYASNIANSIVTTLSGATVQISGDMSVLTLPNTPDDSDDEPQLQVHATDWAIPPVPHTLCNSSAADGCIGSNAVQVELYDASSAMGVAVPNANSPFIIHLRPATTQFLQNLTKVQCAYFDEYHQNWSTAGCTVLSVNNTDIVCACTHLSLFAAMQLEPAAIAEGTILKASDFMKLTAANIRRDPSTLIFIMLLVALYLAVLPVAVYKDSHERNQGKVIKKLDEWDRRATTHVRPITSCQRAWAYVRDRHLWLSIYFRPFGHPFSSVERLSCQLSLLFIMYAFNAIFVGQPRNDANLAISFAASIISSSFMFIFKNIFVRSGPHSVRENYEIEKGLATASRRLPNYCHYVGLSILLGLCVAMSVVMLAYGVTYETFDQQEAGGVPSWRERRFWQWVWSGVRSGLIETLLFSPLLLIAFGMMIPAIKEFLELHCNCCRVQSSQTRKPQPSMHMRPFADVSNDIDDNDNNDNNAHDNAHERSEPTNNNAPEKSEPTAYKSRKQTEPTIADNHNGHNENENENEHFRGSAAEPERTSAERENERERNSNEIIRESSQPQLQKQDSEQSNPDNLESPKSGGSS